MYLLETFSSYTGTVVTTIIKHPRVLQCVFVESDCHFLTAYSHQCDLLSVGQTLLRSGLRHALRNAAAAALEVSGNSLDVQTVQINKFFDMSGIAAAVVTILCLVVLHLQTPHTL